MITKLVEVTNGERNFGKFMVGVFAEEWERRSIVNQGGRLLNVCGWTRSNIVVLDLQTGEGGVFAPWGSASHDLSEKHQIWVCPMFEPFLVWLYDHTRTRDDWFDALPEHLDLPDAPFAMRGYRRTRKTP